jgi:hypothetical protein
MVRGNIQHVRSQQATNFLEMAAMNGFMQNYLHWPADELSFAEGQGIDVGGGNNRDG